MTQGKGELGGPARGAKKGNKPSLDKAVARHESSLGFGECNKIVNQLSTKIGAVAEQHRRPCPQNAKTMVLKQLCTIRQISGRV